MKSYLKLTDGSIWPKQHVPDLEWTLRYGRPEDVVAVRMVAASVVSAYEEIVRAKTARRNQVVRELREDNLCLSREGSNENR
jgi:hypothetical protein